MWSNNQLVSNPFKPSTRKSINLTPLLMASGRETVSHTITGVLLLAPFLPHSTIGGCVLMRSRKVTAHCSAYHWDGKAFCFSSWVSRNYRPEAGMQKGEPNYITAPPCTIHNSGTWCIIHQLASRLAASLWFIILEQKQFNNAKDRQRKKGRKQKNKGNVSVKAVGRELTPSDMQSGCQEKRPANKQMSRFSVNMEDDHDLHFCFHFFQIHLDP